MDFDLDSDGSLVVFIHFLGSQIKGRFSEKFFFDFFGNI